jgi:hypothetical protein
VRLLIVLTGSELDTAGDCCVDGIAA